MSEEENETVNTLTGVEVTEGLEDAETLGSDRPAFPTRVIESLEDAIPQLRKVFPVSDTELSVLASFSHVLRFRVGKDFSNGPWEGRLKLEFGDHVVSGKTLQDVHSQLAAKASEVLAERAAHEKKVAERRG